MAKYKNYKEIKHEIGIEDEKRAWVNPQPTGRTVALEDHQAEDFNSQFVNTGIKYELIEEPVEEKQEEKQPEQPKAPAESKPETENK